jgi:hypothetical protein
MATIALEGIVVAVAASDTPLQVNWGEKITTAALQLERFEDIASRTERSRGVERPTNALRAHQPVSKARA